MDVRAPVEFLQGSLPGSVNLPIMDNEQRARVGTAYKQQGREVAIALGHELVSGPVKEQRLESWKTAIQQKPETVLYCFRGGLRSKITQRWLAEQGVHRPLIEGGFKQARQFLRDATGLFSQQKNILLLSGPTGSAKTEILKKASAFTPALDLELLARHRGSAFGGMGHPQPSQIDFENALALGLLQNNEVTATRPLLVEDESRLIGRCAVPEDFFARMRASPVVFVEETFEQRVENILSDYVMATAIGRGHLLAGLEQFSAYRKSVQGISKKLGGLRAQELLQDIQVAETRFTLDQQDTELNKNWIAKLLKYYYDPMYASNLLKRNPQVLLRGDAKTILDYLSN